MSSTSGGKTASILNAVSSASGGDDRCIMASILNVMSSTSGGDDHCKIATSELKAMSSTSVGDDGCKMQDDDGREMPKSCGSSSSSMEEADKGGNRKMRKGRGSSSVYEADRGGESSLKKGPWTQEEDAILREHVEKHGEGNWNAVQRNSGLARCGKSCRLRWANHLRPNLKKGAFTAEEERRIVKLHASMGNKWAKMATELPGRTDNEIKNFWNTRVKRRQRAGLTAYPEELEIHRQQVSNGNQGNLNPDALTNEVSQLDNISQTENFGIPDVEFRGLTLPPSLYDPSLYMPMPPVSCMLAQLEQDTYSSQCDMSPMMHPSKRLRRSEMIYSSAVLAFDQYGNNSFNNSTEPLMSCLYDPILNTGDQFGNDLRSSHVALNGNVSTSEPINGAFKVELPSVQYVEARKRILLTHESSLPPLVEAVDTPESSTQFQPTQSIPVPSQNNEGLLETILYGFKNSNGSNNVDSFQENNDYCFLNEAEENNDYCFHNEAAPNSFQENNDYCFHNEAEENNDYCFLNEAAQNSFQQNNDHCLINEAAENSFQQNNDLLQNSFQQYNDHCLFNEAAENSFQHNNDHWLLNETVQNSTLSPSETQWDDPEILRSSLGPFSDSVLADCTNITNCIFSVETSQDQTDKRIGLTQFPDDSSGQENIDPFEFLLDPDPAPDLSFSENDYFNGYY